MSPYLPPDFVDLCRRSFLLPEHRYEFFREGLDRLLKIPAFENLSAIYPADYKQDELTPSKWNWSVPLAIRPQHKPSFVSSIALQVELRDAVEKFSFSDFIFRDLPLKAGVVFRRSTRNHVDFSVGPVGPQLTIEVALEKEIPWLPPTVPSGPLEYDNMDKVRETKSPVSWETAKDCLGPQTVIETKLRECLLQHSLYVDEVAGHLSKIAMVIVSSIAVQGIDGFHYIPSITRLENRRGSIHQISSGGFIIPFFSELERLSTEQIQMLSMLAQCWFSQTAIVDFSRQATLRIRKEAARAGMSTNLARTLSHNTGSHSLNALGSDEKLDAAFKRIERCIDKEPLPGAVYSVKDAEPHNAVHSVPYNEDDSQQRRVWLGIYNNYLRERMDLLADITTAIPMYETSKALVKDVLRGFERNYLLTTTIAGANEFDYRFAYALSDGQEDVNAAIPGDALGSQCCWLIMENMIRNSAKHGAHPPDEPVVYSVNVEVHTNDYLRVSITEKHPDRNALDAAELATARNTDIDAEVLDKNDQVRQTALGMLEMKAACAYLRKVGMDEIDDMEYRTNAPLPLLKAISGDDREFGYQFFLRRPKGVVHVLSDEAIKSLPPAGTADDDSPRALRALLNAGVCDHPLLLIKLEDAKILGVFISALLTDINAFPHEMLLCSSLIPTQQALDDLIDAAVGPLKSSDKPSAALVHSASVLKMSIYLIDKAEYASALQHSGQERLLQLRRIWLTRRMTAEQEHIPLGINTHLYSEELERYQSTSAKQGISVDYAPHNENSKGFEEALIEFLKPEASTASGGAPLDLCDQLREHYMQGKRRAYVLRFPSSVEHVMETQKQSIPPVRQALLTQAHVAYWLKATAVIDERIQQAAQTDTYSLGAQKGKQGQTEIIAIERLLAAAGVFTPPTTINLQQNTFNNGLWTELLGWLGKLRPMLSYSYVHLGVLEKFSATLERPVSELIAQIKTDLTGVRIIVISGRGKPHTLPPGELFVNYSAASQYLTQTYTRAPVLLSTLSHSARRLKQ